MVSQKKEPGGGKILRGGQAFLDLRNLCRQPLLKIVPVQFFKE
jgi:hypothetical protein